MEVADPETTNNVIISDVFAYPLFVDYGVEVILKGCYQWVSTDGKIYGSQFPILVKSGNFPHLYVSLANFNEENPINIKQVSTRPNAEFFNFVLNYFKEGYESIQFRSIYEFDCYSYLPDSKNAIILTCPQRDNSNFIFPKTEVDSILNPMGIGVFYTNNKDNLVLWRKNPLTEFIPVPYSIEIMNKVLYSWNGKDYSLYEVFICVLLLNLHYQLEPFCFPSHEFTPKKIMDRSRVILERFILNNPPIERFQGKDLELCDNGIIVASYQWVCVKIVKTFDKIINVKLKSNLKFPDSKAIDTKLYKGNTKPSCYFEKSTLNNDHYFVVSVPIQPYETTAWLFSPYASVISVSYETPFHVFIRKKIK